MTDGIKAGSIVKQVLMNGIWPEYFVDRIVTGGAEPMAEFFSVDRWGPPVWLLVSNLVMVK